MPVQQAAAVLGLDPEVILRRASDGHSGIHHRVAGKMGPAGPAGPADTCTCARCA